MRLIHHIICSYLCVHVEGDVKGGNIRASIVLTGYKVTDLIIIIIIIIIKK